MGFWRVFETVALVARKRQYSSPTTVVKPLSSRYERSASGRGG